MKVLFPVRPGIVAPLGIMYLSSYLKRAGHEVCAVRADYNSLKGFLRHANDAILAYSSMTYEVPYFIKLNRCLKEEFRFISLFGGAHATFYPEVIEEDGIDGVCIGEGEYALAELVDRIGAGDDITAVQNWWIKKDGKIFKNAVRPLIENLDELLFPDRNLLPHNYLWNMIIAGKGCPFNCSYCFNTAYYELYGNPSHRIRIRSVDNVIAELYEIKSANLLKSSWLSFADSIFVSNMEWVREFSEKYKEKIDVPFVVNQRPELVTEEWLDCLKYARCFSIRIGIESGDPEIRKNVLKRGMDDEVIIRACGLIKTKGIMLRTFNILGIPGGSIETDFKTLDLNIKCRPTVTSVFLMEPYQKTEIYAIAKKMDLLEEDNDLDSSHPSTHRTSMIRYRGGLEKRMTENLHKLFSLAVIFPVLSPLIKYIIKLPLNWLYAVVFWIITTYQLCVLETPSLVHLYSRRIIRNIREGFINLMGYVFEKK